MENVLLDHLIYAKRKIADLEEELERLPDIQAMADLIVACEALDSSYKRWCEEADEDDRTTYNEGANVEFYVEAVDMHDMSIALRRLIK